MSKRILVADEIKGLQQQSMNEVASSPSTPASGTGLIYVKADGKFYSKNDAGVEKELGSSDLSGYQQTSQKGAANGYASLDANAQVPIAQIPPAALERLVIVADQAARYALTTATVQNGDTVKQNDNGEMYFVKDDSNLGNAAGYSVYTAGTASAVEWSGILNVDEQVSDLAGLSYTGNAGMVIKVNGTEDGWELVADSDAQNAAAVPYSNATSGLAATDVQAAIDEVEGRVDALESTPAGATVALDNLSGVAINADLIFDKASPILASKDQSALPSEGLTIKSGDVTSTTDVSGSINILSGASIDGNSGNISIDTAAPSGTGTKGDISIGGNTTTIGPASVLQLFAPQINIVSSTSVDLSGSAAVVVPNDTSFLTQNAVNHTALMQRSGVWYRVIVDSSYFTAAALSETKNLISMSAGEMIEAVFVKPSVAFAGPSLTAATISVGTSTSGVASLSSAYSVFAIGDAAQQYSSVFFYNTVSDSQQTISLNTVGCNIDDLTAGQVEILIKMVNPQFAQDVILS